MLKSFSVLAVLLCFFKLEASSFVHQNFENQEIIFIKLGGSLITDRMSPYTEKPEILEKLAKEIAHLVKSKPQLKVIIGHGSGSFGHRAAIEYHYDRSQGFLTTRDGANVAKSARELHAIVISALLKAGVPAFSIPPSATGRLDRKTLNLIEMDIKQVRRVLEIGGIPVVYGDVIPFRDGKGTGIASTEKIFSFLALHFKPSKIFLLEEAKGVCLPHLNDHNLIEHITPQTWAQIVSKIEGERGDGVTGGMRQKIDQMIKIVEKNPKMEIYVASGLAEGVLEKLYISEEIGTKICAKNRRPY